MTTDIAALAERARGVEVVVVGAGAAGLVAALEFAKVGMPVTVLEAAPRAGGALRSQLLDGLAVDVGAESFATRGGHVASVIAQAGLASRVVSPASGGAWVAGLPGAAAAPLPAGGVLGIPANPWDPAVRRVLGPRGTWRAYLDRLRPPLTIGHERSLGALVRSRMGAAVLERLVAPVTAGVYSAHPDDIDVERAAPGLSAALTRTGSLSGAVAILRAGANPPGSAVEGLDGGMAQLADALVRRLAERDAVVTTGTAAVALEHGPAGRWQVRTADSSYRADIVVIATGESEARRLLAPLLPGLDPEEPGPDVEIVVLVVDAPALDAAPRGSGVLVVPGSHRAKALTHATAKWPWLAREAGPGRHVLRVSFGAQGEPPATAELDDRSAAELALREASALLGVPLEAASVRAAGRARYRQSQPAAVLGRRERVDRAREAIATLPGVGAVGAWLSGTGLAQVVPDAIEQAGLLRRGPLFSDAGRP